jgi:hypothetical protein
LKNGESIDYSKFHTSAHNLYFLTNHSEKNKIIPILKHLESFEYFCNSVKNFLGGVPNGFDKINNIIIPVLTDVERNGIYTISEEYEYSQYNIYTSTGRPSNRFGGINYAAMNKGDGSRDRFVSRFKKDGKMLLIDYSAFHPRIICNIIDFHIPIDKDIYEYLGELYFNQSTPLTEYQMSDSKKMTFRQLYGGIEDCFSHIKYFNRLKDYIESQWDFFNKNDYVFTPFFNRKITRNHIVDPQPHKLFNYILQASESEISLSILQKINSYLSNKKTKAVLYTYDSVLYDFNKDDGAYTLKDLINLHKDDRFPIKCYVGDSYGSVEFQKQLK